MASDQLTIIDLTRILREAAGTADGIEGGDDILDRPFIDLGYDSLALLETAGRIERERGIQLDDSTVGGAETPRAFLDAVNEQLAAQRVA